MSIWSSWMSVGSTDEARQERRTEGAPNGQVFAYAKSHLYPTEYIPARDAAVDMASIPPWCVPDHEKDAPRWLRLGMLVDDQMAAVVMDQAAVAALVQDLRQWLGDPDGDDEGGVG